MTAKQHTLQGGQLSEEERILERLRSAAHRSGLNPRNFMMLLSDAIERKLWERLPEPISFLAFVDKMDLTSDALEAILRIPTQSEHWTEQEHKRYEVTRKKVRELLTQPKPRRGETGRGRDRSYNVRPKSSAKGGGNTGRDILTRLRRDFPALAKRVDDGELSANKAAIEAGFRKPTASIPIDSPKNIVKALKRKGFTDQELRNALQEEAPVEKPIETKDVLGDAMPFKKIYPPIDEQPMSWEEFSSIPNAYDAGAMSTKQPVGVTCIPIEDLVLHVLVTGDGGLMLDLMEPRSGEIIQALSLCRDCISKGEIKFHDHDVDDLNE